MQSETLDANFLGVKAAFVGDEGGEGTVFSRSDSLKILLRIHTEEKIHVCVVCNKAFSQSVENAGQAAEIVKGLYGADTVTANYVQFWFNRFRSGIFYVKDAPRTF
ncbi:hypothetical protein TNCV_4966721 [Trichonephila clavipes]|nr:hypothetical protein TNCV_4966721 [Trichonephila clavipes]